MKTLNKILALLVCICSSMLGYNINVAAGSCCPLFWAVVDFVFWPLAWIKWCVCQQINLSVIKHTFAWFLQ